MHWLGCSYAVNALLGCRTAVNAPRIVGYLRLQVT